MLDMLIDEAVALSLPCYDLLPASDGDAIYGYWGGTRSDVPETFPLVVTMYKSRRHIVSIDSSLFDSLGFKSRGAFALTRDERSDGLEHAAIVPLASGSVASAAWEHALPLKAVGAVSLPPLEAVVLYGGPRIDSWLGGLGLQRWQYAELNDAAAGAYQTYFFERCPLTSGSAPVARVGGWHLLWSDDQFYIPREMRLMLWTFQDAEPYYEVFLSGMLNHVVRERIS